MPDYDTIGVAHGQRLRRLGTPLLTQALPIWWDGTLPYWPDGKCFNCSTEWSFIIARSLSTWCVAASHPLKLGALPERH